MKEIKKQNVESQKQIIIKEHNVWLFVALFAFTTLIYFSGQLFGNTFFWEDFLEYVYPVQTYAAYAASEGSIPFWNPYIFSGMPFIADIQVGFFYPFNRLLTFFLDSNGHLSVWGLQFIVIIHFLIAQLSFFFLMRSKNVSQLGSAIGGIAYSFSMMMVFHVIHPMMIYHLAWFPLVFMLFIKALDKGDYRYGIGAGLILGTTMLAGHPQTTLYEAFFLGIYYLWHLGNNLKIIDKKKLTLSLISGAVTFIVAVGVFQIQFLTSRELADLSLRADISVEKSAKGSLEFKQITNFVNPHQFGKMSGDQNVPNTFTLTTSEGVQADYFYYWETAFYFGTISLLLGIIGILVTIKSKFTQFLLMMIIFGLLYALGSNFFLHGLMDNLPFFGQFRIPSRMMLYVIFGTSILAGIGFDSLLAIKYREIDKTIYISSGIVILLVLFSLFGGFGGSDSLNSSLMALLFSFVSISLIIASGAKKLGYYLSGSLMIIVLFIDLYLAGGSFSDSKEDPAAAYQIDSKMLSSFKPDYPDNIFRVNTRSYSPPFMATKRNQGMVDRFMSTEGYNPLVLQRVNPALGTNDSIYDLLNVKYILKINPQTNQPYFEENFDKMPNAWLVNKAHIFDDKTSYGKMKTGNYDFLKEVILEEPISVKLNPDEAITSKVVCREYKANYLRYEIINPEKDMILVLSEIWYPAWKVFVDGLPAKLYRANWSLRAIEIPRGASKVELRFASESFALGQWITIVTLLISIPLLIINLNNRIK